MASYIYRGWLTWYLAQQRTECNIEAGDCSLLARFFHADRAVSIASNELDTFDGRYEMERCNRLVTRLRTGQDRLLALTWQIMDELIGDERAPREFRAKFPDEVLQDSLAGQLWFGAECLAAGSNILNREAQSVQMRPLAKAVLKSLTTVRNLLREQCLRHNTPNGPLILDSNDRLTEILYESLKIFDRIFAEFELLYVSAMVPVKSQQEYEIQQLICVLFSETVKRALDRGILQQEQIDCYDPALMFSIPRLAIVSGLLIFGSGPLNVDQSPEDMSEMFRPFRGLLHKIRELLRILDERELRQLEQLLCTSEDLDMSKSSISMQQSDLDCSLNSIAISTVFTENPDWREGDTKESEMQQNQHYEDEVLVTQDSGYLITNTSFGTLLQNETLLGNNFPRSDDSSEDISFEEHNSYETLSQFLQSEVTYLNKNEEEVKNKTISDSGVCTENTSLDRSPEAENASAPINQEELRLNYSQNWEELYKYQPGCSRNLRTENDNNCDNFSLGEGTSSRYNNVNICNDILHEDDEEIGAVSNERRYNSINHDISAGYEHSAHSLDEDSSGRDECICDENCLASDESSASSDESTEGRDTGYLSNPELRRNRRDDEIATAVRKRAVARFCISAEHHRNMEDLERMYNDITVMTNNLGPEKLAYDNLISGESSLATDCSSGDTSPFTSDCGDPREIALAINAATRAKFRSTEDLLHRLFVCIAGVADQLQTNFASDLRKILRNVFSMNVSPDDDSITEEPAESKTETNEALYEYRPSKSDVIENGGSNQSINSAEEVIIDNNSSTSSSGVSTPSSPENDNHRRNQRSQSVTLNNRHQQGTYGRSNSFGSNRNFNRNDNLSENSDDSSVVNNNTRRANGSSTSPRLNRNNDPISIQQPPIWVPDSAAPRCMYCGTPFNPIRRRHHCRSCGGVFCGSCSSTMTPLPQFGISKPVRVCDCCYKKELSKNDEV